MTTTTAQPRGLAALQRPADMTRNAQLVADLAYGPTPVFDELAVAHGHELWPPHFERHDGFMARHGQSVWLNDVLGRMEVGRWRDDQHAAANPPTYSRTHGARPRDASGRFTR